MTQTTRAVLLVTTMLSALAIAHPAAAQDASRMDAIEKQIQALQSELRQMRHDLAARDAQVRSAQADAVRARQEAQAAQASSAAPRGAGRVNQAQATPPATRKPAPNPAPNPARSPPAATTPAPAPKAPATSSPSRNGTEQAQSGQATGPLGTFKLGGVTVKLGGFADADGIYRSRNEVADISSSFSTGIPFPNSPLAHENEVRGTARQSRASLLASADVDNAQKLSAYVELDFQGGAPTANSVESNSYNPRLRQAFGTYDNTAWGLHVLGGQAWSLATLFRNGIVPCRKTSRSPSTRNTSPASPGPASPKSASPRILTTRNSGSPPRSKTRKPTHAGSNGTGVGIGTANYQNPGIGILANGSQYSTEIAPDLIVKASYDPGYGHYELYGLGRFLHDRVSVVGTGHNNTVLGGGIGGGLILPIIKNKLDIQFSGLAGYGIGRYGTSQLPDAIIGQDGSPKPIPEVQALLGVIGHPIDSIDLYGYGGTEQERRTSFDAAGKGYGYGSPLYSNAGCLVELSPLPCTANTSGTVQGTVGAWWRFLKGGFGTAELGAQYAYTHRFTFKGVGGSPGADENTALVSFRYLPFQ